MDLTGKTLGSQFVIERKLGQGGMGQVYLARQLDVERQVVIKVMRAELTESADSLLRFRREAQAVARLNHPHVVQVYMFGVTDNGLHYLAMEHISGRSLTDALSAAGRMPEPRVLRITDQICSALAEAHGHGLVHRDLKPDNVMLADRHGNSDYVKVLDFGIAKLIDPTESKLTQTGAIFGSPRYMAPEQARGVSVDARTDLYALGLMLYELLTGSPPFEGATPMQVLMQHATEPVEPLRSRCPNIVVSPRTEAAIMRCLEKDPALRFPSAGALQHELQRALDELTPPVRGYPSAFTHPAATQPPVRPGIGAARTGRASGDDGSGASPEQVPISRATTDARATLDAKAGHRRTRVLGFIALALIAVGGFGIWVVDRGTNVELPSAPALPTNPFATTAEQWDGPIDPAIGLPAPEGARLVSRTAQAVTVSTEFDHDAIVAFYGQLADAWGPMKETPQGLQFDGRESPVSYVSITPMAGGLMVSLMRSGRGAPASSPDTANEAFGAPLMDDAEEYMRTSEVAIYLVPHSRDEVMAFYREHFAGNEEFDLYEMQTENGPYLVINAQRSDRAFRLISINVTPAGLRAGGDSMQVTIQARPGSQP